MTPSDIATKNPQMEPLGVPPWIIEEMRREEMREGDDRPRATIEKMPLPESVSDSDDNDERGGGTVIVVPL